MAPSKFVLITGCSSGIGQSLAYEFHSRGHHVIATARRLESIEALATSGMTTLALDVTSDESIESAKAKIMAITNGKLDILVNNAGITHTSSITDTPLGLVDDVYRTNIRGPIALTQALAKSLVAAGPGGLVINISSASAYVGFPFHGVYAMSKAALNSFARCLSVEMAPFGIDVMTVVTGYIQTPIDDQVTAKPFLPADSLFLDFKPANDPNGPFPENRMPSEQYAKRVVNEAEKSQGWRIGPYKIGGRKDWLWEGTSAPLLWFLHSVMGEAWIRWAIMRTWGISDL